jgi:AraC-like DNA-binding protein
MPRSVLRTSPAPIELPYTELGPPADLARYVDRFWLRTTLRGGRRHRVLPDGCVDVIVHVERGAAELVGTMTRALELPEAPAELVAVRFLPGTAAALTRCALNELTDRQPDLLDVVGRAAGGGALVERVSQAATPRERIAVLVDWLRLQLIGAPPPDPVVAHAITQLVAPTAPRIDQVADQLGVTRQHLARRFRREVGITPKQVARIARMQRAVAALAHGTPDLARLAVEVGYFDQSHFTYDLRELLGTTPAAVAAEHPLALPHLFEG